MNRIIGLAAALVMTMAIPAYAQSAGPDVPEAETQAVSALTGSIIGSWVIDVDASSTPDFVAMHTFHLGGTMNESTDLFAGLGEGPGHGVWQRVGNNEYAATFELFIFNPDASPAGRIRVRETLRVVNENKLTGVAIADLLLPDGEIIENIDTAPVSGTRVRVKAVKPEELLGAANAQHNPRGSW